MRLTRSHIWGLQLLGMRMGWRFQALPACPWWPVPLCSVARLPFVLAELPDMPGFGEALGSPGGCVWLGGGLHKALPGLDQLGPGSINTRPLGGEGLAWAQGLGALAGCLPADCSLEEVAVWIPWCLSSLCRSGRKHSPLAGLRGLRLPEAPAHFVSLLIDFLGNLILSWVSFL